jgi:hypothetical protein
LLAHRPFPHKISKLLEWPIGTRNLSLCLEYMNCVHFSPRFSLFPALAQNRTIPIVYDRSHPPFLISTILLLSFNLPAFSLIDFTQPSMSLDLFLLSIIILDCSESRAFSVVLNTLCRSRNNPFNIEAIHLNVISHFISLFCDSNSSISSHFCLLNQLTVYPSSSHISL